VTPAARPPVTFFIIFVHKKAPFATREAGFAQMKQSFAQVGHPSALFDVPLPKKK